jgi:hypothetical protein
VTLQLFTQPGIGNWQLLESVGARKELDWFANNARMKTKSSLKPGFDSEAELALPLHIVVIADHHSASVGAHKLVDEFVVKWAPETEVHRDDWSFSELEHAEFRRESLELARHCDLLIIAPGGYDDLPESVSEWLREWRQTRAAGHTTFVICASAAPSSALPHLASLPLELCEEGLTCFMASISMRQGWLPAPVRPRALLERLAEIDRTNLPEISILND